MKLFFNLSIVLSFTLLSIVAEAKPHLIKPKPAFLVQSTIHRNDKGNLYVSMSQGFKDSASLYSDESEILPESTAYCYVGRAQWVCNIIDKAAKKSLGTIQVKSCKTSVVNGELIVEATYTLSSETGDKLELTRKIGRCN